MLKKPATSKSKLTHITSKGDAHMVDISGKPRVKRTARASGRIVMAPATIRLLQKGLLKKGDALAAARIAGIMAAKKTGALIPLCHNIGIDHVEVDFKIRKNSVDVSVYAACTDKTGIEMEALTATAVAALTLYDMCKAVDKNMEIGEIKLLKKTKGAVS